MEASYGMVFNPRDEEPLSHRVTGVARPRTIARSHPYHMRGGGIRMSARDSSRAARGGRTRWRPPSAPCTERGTTSLRAGCLAGDDMMAPAISGEAHRPGHAALDSASTITLVEGTSSKGGGGGNPRAMRAPAARRAVGDGRPARSRPGNAPKTACHGQRGGDRVGSTLCSLASISRAL